MLALQRWQRARVRPPRREPCVVGAHLQRETAGQRRLPARGPRQQAGHFLHVHLLQVGLAAPHAGVGPAEQVLHHRAVLRVQGAAVQQKSIVRLFDGLPPHAVHLPLHVVHVQRGGAGQPGQRRAHLRVDLRKLRQHVQPKVVARDGRQQVGRVLPGFDAAGAAEGLRLLSRRVQQRPHQRHGAACAPIRAAQPTSRAARRALRRGPGAAAPSPPGRRACGPRPRRRPRPRGRRGPGTRSAPLAPPPPARADARGDTPRRRRARRCRRAPCPAPVPARTTHRRPSRERRPWSRCATWSRRPRMPCSSVSASRSAVESGPPDTATTRVPPRSPHSSSRARTVLVTCSSRPRRATLGPRAGNASPRRRAPAAAG